MSKRTAVDDQPALARRALDLYNDAKLKAAFARVDTTQMRTVLAALKQAGSYAEAEIVLRYQAARLRDKWDPKLVERLLELFRQATKSAGGDAVHAAAIAHQFGLIVRIHRVANEEARATENERKRR